MGSKIMNCLSAGKGEIFQNICVQSVKFALVGMAKQIINSSVEGHDCGD